MSKGMLRMSLAVLSAAFMMLTACSGKKEYPEAEALYNRAQEAFDAKNYEESLALLDSLDKTPAVETRRRGMSLRARAQEGLFVKQLAQTDSMMAVCQARAEELRSQLKWVSNPVEGYYVAASSELAPSGVQARMNADGVFYIVSQLSGHGVGHTSIRLQSGGVEAASAVVGVDGERNRREGGVETVHFVGEECDSVGKFALEHRSEPVTLVFEGSGRYSRPLTMGELAGIAEVYEVASLITRTKVASLEHQRLEQQLQIAREHIARTFNEADSANKTRR